MSRSTRFTWSQRKHSSLFEFTITHQQNISTYLTQEKESNPHARRCAVDLKTNNRNLPSTKPFG